MLNLLEQILVRVTFYDWLLLIAGVLLTLYIVGTWNYDYFSRRGIPSTRPKLPFMGDSFPLHLAVDTFPNLLNKIYEKGKGYPVYGIFDFQKPTFLIRNPDFVKIITIKEFDHFMNHRNLIPAQAEPIFSKNLFNLEDQKWRDMRTTLSPAFTTSKIKGMFPLVSQCAQQMVEHLRSKCNDSGVSSKGLETDMKDISTRLGNDIIASVAFGVQCDSLKQPENDFYKTGKQLTNFPLHRIIVFLLIFVWPKLAEFFGLRLLNTKYVSFFDSLVHETIRERQKQNIFRPDMLQLLMQAQEGKLRADREDQDESENIGNKQNELTDEDITAQAIIFFFAGFDTVSTALCFTTYQISHNPEVQRRLQQEVDEVWERTGGKPTYEDVQGMKYLDAVINESLRMHPPNIFLERVCQEDTTLSPTASTPAITIRKGQCVSIPVLSIQMDPEYWPNPQRFDPERFSDKNKHNIIPFSHIPFGAGPRLCIGQRLALIELRLTLGNLVRNFEIQPSPKSKYPLEYAKGLNLTIKGGFWNFLIPRNV